MILNTEGNLTIVTQENATPAQLVKKMEDSYSKFKNDNVIVNLSSLEQLSLEQILVFLQLSNTHRKAKHSFVLVSDSVTIDQSIEEIVIVPTLQEAYDIIEMEDMERDLGF